MKKVGRSQPVDCLVSGTLGLMLRASQFAGIAPLKFRRSNQGWAVTISPTQCLVSYIAASVLNVGAIAGFLFDLNAKPTHTVMVHTPTRKVVWISDFLIVMATASVAAYGAPRRLRQTIVCLGRIQKINMATVGYNKSPNEWKTSLAFVLYYAFFVSLFTAQCLVTISDAISKNGELKIACLYSCYYYGYLLLILLEMQFVFTALEVTKSLIAVNNILEEVSHLISRHSAVSDCPSKISNNYVNVIIDSMATIKYDADFMVPPPPAPKSINKTIGCLALMYGELCDAVRQLDDCHGVGVMFLLLSFFLHLIITPYYLILYLYKNKPVVGVFMQLMWCGLHFSCTVLVVEPNHRTQLEINRTNLLVSRMLLKSNDELMSLELKKFSTFLLLNKVTYSPLGICTLTRSLVASIVGSVATYLVIIMQFQLSES